MKLRFITNIDVMINYNLEVLRDNVKIYNNN